MRARFALLALVLPLLAVDGLLSTAVAQEAAERPSPWVYPREIKASGINPVSKLDWSDHIPPETFSFFDARIVSPSKIDNQHSSIDNPPPRIPALVYYPHPETKPPEHRQQVQKIRPDGAIYKHLQRENRSYESIRGRQR